VSAAQYKPAHSTAEPAGSASVALEELNVVPSESTSTLVME